MYWLMKKYLCVVISFEDARHSAWLRAQLKLQLQLDLAIYLALSQYRCTGGGSSY